MEKEKLYNYPYIDMTDFRICLDKFGVVTIDIGEVKLSSDQTLVYLERLREGNKGVKTPTDYKKVLERDIRICGYLVLVKEKRKFLGIFPYEYEDKKIGSIREGEKENVKSELLEILKNKGDIFFKRKVSRVDFWENENFRN